MQSSSYNVQCRLAAVALSLITQSSNGPQCTEKYKVSGMGWYRTGRLPGRCMDRLFYGIIGGPCRQAGDHAGVTAYVVCPAVHTRCDTSDYAPGMPCHGMTVSCNTLAAARADSATRANALYGHNQVMLLIISCHLAMPACSLPVPNQRLST
jgi:hypothetical protein